MQGREDISGRLQLPEQTGGAANTVTFAMCDILARSESPERRIIAGVVWPTTMWYTAGAVLRLAAIVGPVQDYRIK